MGETTLQMSIESSRQAVFSSQVYFSSSLPIYCGFGVGVGVWGWGLGLGLGIWGWGFQLMGFWACDVGPSGVFAVGALCINIEE